MRALPAIFTALVLLGGATARAATSYTVTVTGERPQSVHVVGAFALESNTLGMYVTRSPQLEDGQAAFIRGLAVRDENGEALAYEYEGQGDWKLPQAAPGQKVEIEYDVALEHGKYSWAPGIDEVAYRQDDGLFFTGFSLFILPLNASVILSSVSCCCWIRNSISALKSSITSPPSPLASRCMVIGKL